MYAPNYGFGGASNAQAYNGPSNPHQPGQQPQHMMYNPQQYGAHQSPYTASMAGMNPGAGGLGIMQNSGMTHMGGGNVPSYQTPYSNSPYGAGIPTSSVSLPPNYLAAQSNPSAFGMNPSNMMSQRMQPPTSAPGPQGARQSPYGIPHTSPPNASSAQFAQNPQMRAPTPSNNTQVTSAGTVTPQTPTFPPGTQNQASNLATPLSPGSEVREKERVTLLLDINRELLQEVVHLQGVQAEMKRKEEGQAEGKEGEKGGEGDKPDAEEKAEKDKVARAYIDCMRRLQVNLAYLAAIADRPNKPASQVPPHPAIMTAPALSPRSPKMFKLTSTPAEGKKNEDKSPQPEEARPKTLKDQYEQLLALFPGVDPKKEAPAQQANAAARAQAQQHAAQLQKQGSGGQGNGAAAAGIGTVGAEQQKMQSEMMRQRMVQQQAAQQQRAMAGQGR